MAQLGKCLPSGQVIFVLSLSSSLSDKSISQSIKQASKCVSQKKKICFCVLLFNNSIDVSGKKKSLIYKTFVFYKGLS